MIKGSLPLALLTSIGSLAQGQYSAGNRYANEQPQTYSRPASVANPNMPAGQYPPQQYTPAQYYQPQSQAPLGNLPPVTSAPPGYAPPPGYNNVPGGYTQGGYPQTGYANQTYGQQLGANQSNAPYINSQSSGVTINNSTALPTPPAYVPPPTTQLGYGSPGTYVPETVSQYQIAPGVTDSVDARGGNAAILAPGVVPPGGLTGTDAFTPSPYEKPIREAPIVVYAQEARTGRIVLGGSVNSDLGLAGQVIIDERNFDWRRFPERWGDLFGGRAFRGGGQNFRAELMPGTNVQRYTVNFTQPHLFGYSRIGFGVGGFLFTRQFRDWTEQRLGGRLALSYDINQALSLTTELNLQDVEISSPRVTGVPELDRVLGSNDVYTARVRLAHDTRDSVFMATEGHLLELIFDQSFGEFDYPRGQVNFSRYFLIRQRADGGGRHTLATTWKAGITGSDTPIFDNFFAGGYSTLRGFSFRGASPKSGDVQVGGRTMILGSLEYLFPLTADDMLRGILFVDYGALSKDTNIAWDDYRIAPGFGVRVSVPALGPAPLAFDFAFPVKYADTDDRQVFSFFMGLTK